jgi:anti-anti-sigma factor
MPYSKATAPLPGLVEVEQRRDVAVVRLIGEHDMATVAAVESVLIDLIDADIPVVVSLAEATFIDSTTLGLLCRSEQEIIASRGRRYVIHVDASAPVYRTLAISGVRDILICHGDLTEAISVARQLAPVMSQTG